MGVWGAVKNPHVTFWLYSKLFASADSTNPNWKPQLWTLYNLRWRCGFPIGRRLNPRMWDPRIWRANCISWKNSTSKWPCPVPTYIDQGSTILLHKGLHVFYQVIFNLKKIPSCDSGITNLIPTGVHLSHFWFHAVNIVAVSIMVLIFLHMYLYRRLHTQCEMHYILHTHKQWT